MPYREQAERPERKKGVWFVHVSPSIFMSSFFVGPFKKKWRAWLWAWWFVQRRPHAACGVNFGVPPEELLPV
jgi:hypothetical protein